MTSLKRTGLLVAVGAVVLAGCGRNEVMNKQEGQRGDLAPELQGAWVSKCEGSKVRKVTFTGDILAVERVEFFDKECTDRKMTVRQTGKFELAHNYKEGIPNSVIFLSANDLKVTLHTDFEVDAANSALSQIQNEKEAEIRVEMAPLTKKEITRENQKIRAGKEVQIWKRDEEKTLARFQLEKLNDKGLSAEAGVALDTRASLKYEVDNGYVQFSAGGDFAHVFSKVK